MRVYDIIETRKLSQKMDMQQMAEPAASQFEKRLLMEIERLETQIRELTQEKLALQRQIAKARLEEIPNSEIKRRNSLNRIAVERKIIDEIEHSKKPLRTKDLYVLATGVNFDLKYNTFRNYLYRMKKKELIQSTGHSGPWHLVKDRTKE